MTKKIYKYATVGVICLVLFLTANARTEATGINIISEQAIAGITLSLTNYYESASGQTDARVATASLDEFMTKEQKSMESEQYKNIGIADVDKYLNIRSKGDETSSVVGKLPKNGGCYIYSINENGWAKVKSGKVSGYVLIDYLVTGNEVVDLAKEVGSQIATVNETTVRIREKKSINSDTVTLVPQGEELDVIDNSDPDWVKVSIDNDTGYIAKEYVDIKYQLKKAVSYSEDEAVAASGSVQTSSIRSQMVSYAKQFLGNRYVFGGTSLTNGTDCSGFTMRIYQKFGYNISRTSRSQASKGSSIKVSTVQPGDLVFYSKNGTINHVAMYIGNGQVIHASNPKSGIKISNMYYRTPCKAVRFIN